MMLRARIGIARDLETVNPASWPEMDNLKHEVEQWRDYNRTWLDRNLGGEAADEYRTASTHFHITSSLPPDRELAFVHREVASERSKLESILSRLEMWMSDSGPEPMNKMARQATDAPIFIVHGSDTDRAQLVARGIERGTGREVIILREQPSSGRTLIEKFEDHAQQASYAVVLLTADDEGGRRGDSARCPRARQNVIFEMGYFYGCLGRERVSALLDPGVEQPSDMSGIVYILLADDEAWKRELFREMDHAGIGVDWSRIP